MASCTSGEFGVLFIKHRLVHIGVLLNMSTTKSNRTLTKSVRVTLCSHKNVYKVAINAETWIRMSKRCIWNKQGEGLIAAGAHARPAADMHVQLQVISSTAASPSASQLSLSFSTAHSISSWRAFARNLRPRYRREGTEEKRFFFFLFRWNRLLRSVKLPGSSGKWTQCCDQNHIFPFLYLVRRRRRRKIFSNSVAQTEIPLKLDVHAKCVTREFQMQHLLIYQGSHQLVWPSFSFRMQKKEKRR